MLKEQLNQFNPFDLQDSRLQNIFTGVSADNNDEVNCDQAKQVGFEIQCSLDNIVVNQATIKRSKQVKTFATLLPAIKVNFDTIHADPNVLFQKLIMLIHGAEDLTDCFDYDLTPEPTSLFKDGLMRNPYKAQLGRELVKNSEILRENSEKVCTECTNATENYDTDSSEDDYQSSEDCNRNIFEKPLDFKFCISSL